MNLRTLHSHRRLAAAGARTGCAASTVLFLFSVAGAVASDVAPASAAIAGQAQIISPVEAGGQPLAGGGGATPFSLSLPVGASCTGDATANYGVFSYMVAAGIDPNSLQFDSDGPVDRSYGEPQSGFRSPLYEPTGSPYVAKFPSAAATPGGPGLVVNIPAFDFVTLQPDGSNVLLPPGDYNVGIACWRAGTGAELDAFWNATISVVADPSDPSPVDIAWSATAPATATSVALTTEPAGGATPGAPVTLTAAVQPASALGTITFRDGTDDLGAAVAVAGGSASMSTSDLADGDHVLTASFTPAAGSGFAASSSGEVVLAIGQPTPSSTTTTGSSGSTTTTRPVGATTTTAPTSVAGVSNGSAFGALARTGGSLSMLVWGFLALVFGRMALLLGRKPAVRPARTG